MVEAKWLAHGIHFTIQSILCMFKILCLKKKMKWWFLPMYESTAMYIYTHRHIPEEWRYRFRPIWSWFFTYVPLFTQWGREGFDICQLIQHFSLIWAFGYEVIFAFSWSPNGNCTTGTLLLCTEIFNSTTLHNPFDPLPPSKTFVCTPLFRMKMESAMWYPRKQPGMRLNIFP